jgi:hypothetical protein
MPAVCAQVMAARAACGLACALALAAALTSCAHAPPAARTTFLQSVDLIDMTDRMAVSFAHDEVIGARTPHDERWVVSIDRVVNHTNQIIPDREKWQYIGRLRSLLAQSDIARQRSIAWVVPPERWPAIAREIGAAGGEPPELRMQPTHVLTAEFHALTATSARGRSDMYVCSYQLVDLRTGTIAWEDSWEVKRATTGLTFD